MSTKETEGSGYGLAIVKNMVEKYHGTITLTSDEGEGTTFRVEVPRDTKALAS